MGNAAGPSLRKPVIGVIGGIGSGKSLISAMLAALGGHLIEADKLGHEGLKQPAIRDRVVQRWGAKILDQSGEVDRRKLGAIVFSDSNERQALEAIVFPWIEKRISEEIENGNRSSDKKFSALDAAIMLEAGWNRLCDLVIFVHASRPRRLQRLAGQRGWTTKEVESRENAQLSLEEKAARADAIIDNDGDPAHTRGQVERLLAEQLPRLSTQRST